MHLFSEGITINGVPIYKKDRGSYNTSIDSIQPGEIWNVNFPYQEKGSKKVNHRPCVVLKVKEDTVEVIRCTHGNIHYKENELNIGKYRIDCGLGASVKPKEFSKRLYKFSDEEFNQIKDKVKEAKKKQHFVHLVLEMVDYFFLYDEYVVEGCNDIITEAKLKAAERTDFGIPSKKKFPMPDEAHVRAAIRMFNHCDPEDEAELARNIKKYMNKYGIEDIEVGENNRFSKYYKKPVKESYIEESSNKKYHTYEDAKFVFDSLTEQEQYWVAPHGYKNVPCFYRKCAYDSNKNTPVGFVDIYRVNQNGLDDPNTNVAKVIIAVSEPFRGKGIARTLIKKAVHRFKDSDIDILRYNVVDGNDASIEFAKKVGFLYDFHSKKHGLTSFLITNGNKMQDAIGEGGSMVIQEFKQPKPLNPNVKDYELLSEKERRELETLSQEIREWAANVRKREGTK